LPIVAYLCNVNTKIKQLSALVSLLDDPDQTIHHQAVSALTKLHVQSIPLLEELLLNDFISIDHIGHLEQIIEEIRLKDAMHKLACWKKGSKKSLLDALFIISALQYPDVTKEDIRFKLNEMKQGIWIEINPKQTSFEIIQRFNRVFFDFYRFKRVSAQNTGPFAYFLPSILDEKEGEALGLGLIYSIIATELDLPIYGVRFPFNRFMLAYMDNKNILSLLDEESSNGILLYLSMQEKGRIMTKNHLENYLTQVNQPSHPSFFEPASNTDLVIEYLQQIIHSCQNHPGFGKKANRYYTLLSCLEEVN